MTIAFGTDGIRGVANEELTVEVALALGRAAASVFPTGTSAPVLIGRDTRQSGAMLQTALTAGFCSEGVDVVDLGVLPTPGVAYLSSLRDVPAAVISASHNPYVDNGIKFFLPGGRKLSDEVEQAIEDELREQLTLLGTPEKIQRSNKVGNVTVDHNAVSQYIEHLRSVIGNRELTGLNVVVDCANGAASSIAETVFASLGAEVIVINNEPNGTNINLNCGSTHLEVVADAVLKYNAHVGLALDGDADRVLAVDEKGNEVDGDYIIAMLATDMHGRGLLLNDSVVVTVMSNLGFRLAMEKNGIRIVETAVGDRYVLDALEREGLSIGGEQSGHIILPQYATTGDGLLTALELLVYMVRAGKPLSVLAAESMTQLPQVLCNVKVKSRDLLQSTAAIWDEVDLVEKELGHDGRVLLRSSGTEPVVRVMVEATTTELATQMCDRLCVVVEQAIGVGK